MADSPADAVPPAVKVSVTTRVLSGSKVLAISGKRYNEAATVQIMVDDAMAKVEDPTMELLKVESFASQEATEKPLGVELELDELHEVTAAHLRDDFGRFLVARVKISEGGGSGSLPSAFDPLKTGAEKQARAEASGQIELPNSAATTLYHGRLFNAIAVQLKSDGLGFNLLDARGSGRDMLRTLSHALQYLLPFDDAESQPLRAPGIVQLVIPRRFTTSQLKSPTLRWMCLCPSHLLTCRRRCWPRV